MNDAVKGGVVSGGVWQDLGVQTYRLSCEECGTIVEAATIELLAKGRHIHDEFVCQYWRNERNLHD